MKHGYFIETKAGQTWVRCDAPLGIQDRSTFYHTECIEKGCMLKTNPTRPSYVHKHKGRYPVCTAMWRDRNIRKNGWAKRKKLEQENELLREALRTIRDTEDYLESSTLKGPALVIYNTGYLRSIARNALKK